MTDLDDVMLDRELLISAEKTLEQLKKGGIKHNPTNYEALNSFYDRDREALGQILFSQKQERVKKNLDDWVKLLPPRWVNADLCRIKSEYAKQILARLPSEPELLSFLFSGSMGSGKTFHAYALIREYVRQGLVSPAQIRITSDMELSGFTSQGYLGANELDRMFTSGFRLFFVDEVGRSRYKDTDAKYATWDRLINHVYSEGLGLILASNMSGKNVLSYLSNAASDRLRLLANGRVIKMDGDNYRIKLAQQESVKKETGQVAE